MKAIRIFTDHWGDLPAFFDYGGRRVFASVGICASVPVDMASMQGVPIVQIVIDGLCWEGEVVCVAPADEAQHCLIAYRMACPVEGNTQKAPGSGHVRFVNIARRGQDLTGAARSEAEDRLAALVRRQTRNMDRNGHDDFTPKGTPMPSPAPGDKPADPQHLPPVRTGSPRLRRRVQAGPGPGRQPSSLRQTGFPHETDTGNRPQGHGGSGELEREA